jgi:orotidine-5'-phosphate decarboxylase
VPVLLDAKRGDIGSTSEAYAVAAYKVQPRALQVNRTPHVPQKLTGLISLYQYPVSIFLSVLFLPSIKALNPLSRRMAGFV